MSPLVPTPLIRLSNLFPRREVYAKCEFVAPSGCFKIRGAMHLLDHLREEGGTRQLIVPSMGNTALGAATAAQALGFSMTGVVPQTISRAKDEKLSALGVELIKIAGGGSDLLRYANDFAKERGGYFVHPHLDPLCAGVPGTPCRIRPAIGEREFQRIPHRIHPAGRGWCGGRHIVHRDGFS